ncbi:MAG: hypothetical protein ABGW77_00845 [Campylobacterales bacterium]
MTPEELERLKNRKLTGPEKGGVTAALLMFFGIGMIMGGSSGGNNPIFYTGTGIFSMGAGIALYLLFKYQPSGKGAWDEEELDQKEGKGE